MENGLDALDGPPAGREVANVALDELDEVRDGGEVLPLPRREVVQDADFVPSRDEALDDVRADEARSAGHQASRHTVVP